MLPRSIHIAINHDDYHASYVGQTSNGLQFFLTQPFIVSMEDDLKRREFLALYTFDADGNFLEAFIDDLGELYTYSDTLAQRLTFQRLDQLGNKEYTRILIRPFSVQFAGILFGLIVHTPHDVDGLWTATFEPGNYMSFTEPWDSGEYDT